MIHLKDFKMSYFLQKNPTFFAVSLVFLAVFIFSTINATVKGIGDLYPVTQILFFRFLFALFPLLFLMRKQLSFQSLKTHNLKLHIFCGIIIFLGIDGLFLSFRYLPLADAQAISFSSSIFVTALAVPLIGEKVGIHRWISVLVGFMGILIIVRPTGDIINYGALFGLTFAFTQALVLLYARVILQSDTPLLMTFYTTTIALILSVPFLAFFWVTPSFQDLILLVVLGIGSGIAQLTLTHAYKYAEASFLAPFLYSALIWGILFDYMLWEHTPNLTMVGGAAIIITSGLYILMREQMHKRAAAQKQ